MISQTKRLEVQNIKWKIIAISLIKVFVWILSENFVWNFVCLSEKNIIYKYNFFANMNLYRELV